MSNFNSRRTRLPQTPQVKLPQMPQVTLPKTPQVTVPTVKIEIPKVTTPTLPQAPQVTLPSVATPEIPSLDTSILPDLPKLDMDTTKTLSNLIKIPEIKLPSINLKAFSADQIKNITGNINRLKTDFSGNITKIGSDISTITNLSALGIPYNIIKDTFSSAIKDGISFAESLSRLTIDQLKKILIDMPASEGKKILDEIQKKKEEINQLINENNKLNGLIDEIKGRIAKISAKASTLNITAIEVSGTIDANLDKYWATVRYTFDGKPGDVTVGNFGVKNIVENAGIIAAAIVEKIPMSF
jgi:hypothetical protein